MWRPELGCSQPRCGLMGRSWASHWAMRLFWAYVLHGDRVPRLLVGPLGLEGRDNARGQWEGWPLSGDSMRGPGTDAAFRKGFLHAMPQFTAKAFYIASLDHSEPPFLVCL